MTTKAAPVLQLQLPRSTHAQATILAKREGISLEEFIVLAVAEKVAEAENPKQGKQLRSKKVVTI